MAFSILSSIDDGLVPLAVRDKDKSAPLGLGLGLGVCLRRRCRAHTLASRQKHSRRAEAREGPQEAAKQRDPGNPQIFVGNRPGQRPPRPDHENQFRQPANLCAWTADDSVRTRGAVGFFFLVFSRSSVFIFFVFLFFFLLLTPGIHRFRPLLPTSATAIKRQSTRRDQGHLINQSNWLRWLCQMSLRLA